VDLALIACEVLRSEVAFAPTSEAAWHAAQQSLACAGKAAAAHGRAQFEEGSLGSTTTVAQAARAAALLVLGRAVEARLAIDAAEAHGFPADEIAMMRAEASILAGDAGDALALAAALPDPWPDTWALRAAAHALAGEEGLAQQAADEAAARSATGWRLAHRATWVPALRAATTKDFSPIFVFGADRSGTTLLRAMLDAHPRIAIGPETNLVEAIGALRDAQASDPHRPLSDRGVPVRALDRAVRAYIERLLMELAGEKPRVGEKTPANLYHVHLLARLFPRARFIHVVRDGRDVAASLVAQAWRDPASGALFSHCSDPVSAARYWQEAAGRAFFGVARAPGRALTIHYDALVAEPEATLRRVLRFLGEPWSASVLDPGAGARFSEREASTAAVREPIHGRAVSRAQRDFDAPTLAAVEAACGSLLREVHPASAPNRSNACVA
jgi:hypothetical protein